MKRYQEQLAEHVALDGTFVTAYLTGQALETQADLDGYALKALGARVGEAVFRHLCVDRNDLPVYRSRDPLHDLYSVKHLKILTARFLEKVGDQSDEEIVEQVPEFIDNLELLIIGEMEKEDVRKKR